jgi:hypothetical protein
MLHRALLSAASPPSPPQLAACLPQLVAPPMHALQLPGSSAEVRLTAVNCLVAICGLGHNEQLAPLLAGLSDSQRTLLEGYCRRGAAGPREGGQALMTQP